MKKSGWNKIRSRFHYKITNLQLVVAVLAIAATGLLYWQASLNASKNQWNRLQSELAGIDAPGASEGAGEASPDKLPLYITVPILMYRHISAAPESADFVERELSVAPEDFEKQAAWLKSEGYQSISLASVLLYTQGKFTLPDKPVIFTFDGGYQDAFDNAVPILKKYGFTGSFAVITQFPGIRTSDSSYASWDAIRTAHKSGMEIISNTQDHFDGTSAQHSNQFILDNLSNAQKDIQKNLGVKPLPVLAYPNGHYDQRYIALAQQAGISMGLTEHAGKRIYFADLMQVPRIRVTGGETLDEFERNIKW